MTPRSPLPSALLLVAACGTDDGRVPADGALSDVPPPNPPTIHVMQPNGGETLYPADPYAISWERTDNPAFAATYEVELLDEAGAVITTIATGVTTPYTVWSPSGVPAPTAHKIRVTVTNAGGSTTDESDATFTLAPPRTGTSLARDVQPIFSASCLTQFCHTTTTQTAKLVLAPGVSYENLVAVKSIENPCTSYDRVKPGMPDASYLMFKLAGSGPCFFGVRMPKSAPALAPSAIATIRAWITEGALDN